MSASSGGFGNSMTRACVFSSIRRFNTRPRYVHL
jgi:hypothetical protein